MVYGENTAAGIFFSLTPGGTVTNIPAEAEDVPSNPHKLVLEGHRDDVLSVAFSPDGRDVRQVGVGIGRCVCGMLALVASSRPLKGA